MLATLHVHIVSPQKRLRLSLSTVSSHGFMNWMQTERSVWVLAGANRRFYRRFAELCAHTRQDTGLAVTFTSRSPSDYALLGALKGNVHFIRVSMDGIDATYESLRGRSLKALQQRLSAIRDIAPFGINSVVNSDTLSDIDAAAAFSQSWLRIRATPPT